VKKEAERYRRITLYSKERRRSIMFVVREKIKKHTSKEKKHDVKCEKTKETARVTQNYHHCYVAFCCFFFLLYNPIACASHSMVVAALNQGRSARSP
jgi:hypothetical protein